MKRSILVFALAGLAALSMSCGGKQTAKTAGLTVRLLTDESGIDDRSFNAAAWRGILSSYGDNWDNPVEKGKLYDFVAVASPDMYLSTLRQASEEKRDLIIMTGDVWANALAEIAPKYPNQKYLIVDVNNIKAPNVMQIVFSEHEGAYLVGLAVGLKAQADGIKTPKFGFIGGQPGSVITKFEMGYIQGVKSVLPDATFLDYYANNWARPELAKIQAKNWYDNGVYAIFSAAGATGNGTIAQAKENRSQKKNVWAIGVDSDQFQDGIYSADSKSAVLTSMIKRVETASSYAIEHVRSGSFKGQVVLLDTKSNGIGFSDRNPELSPEIVAKVNEAKAKIISGAIKVIPSYGAAKAAGLVPDNLQASDK